MFAVLGSLAARPGHSYAVFSWGQRPNPVPGDLHVVLLNTTEAHGNSNFLFPRCANWHFPFHFQYEPHRNYENLRKIWFQLQETRFFLGINGGIFQATQSGILFGGVLRVFLSQTSFHFVPFSFLSFCAISRKASFGQNVPSRYTKLLGQPTSRSTIGRPTSGSTFYHQNPCLLSYAPSGGPKWPRVVKSRKKTENKQWKQPTMAKSGQKWPVPEIGQIRSTAAKGGQKQPRVA